MMQLDVRDRKLLHWIDLNARLGTSALGRKIGISQEGSYYRLQRLERLKIITGYMTFLNFSKIGYTGHAVYARFQNVTRTGKSRIVSELARHSHIYWIAEFGGKYDIAFGIIAKDIVHFNELFTEISTKYSEFLKDFTVAIR